jgi:cytochrome c-type protein NapC
VKKTLFGIIIVGMILGIFISYTTAIEIKKTEGGAFCGQCHTMQAATQAHYHSIHGGENRYGVAAQCVDCHLPHDTLTHYIAAKIKYGVRDIYTEFFTDTSEINWTKKRANASSFVYNSGCLSCHSSLDHSEMEGIDPEIVKKADEGTLKTSCISCHPSVGHRWKEAKQRKETAQ